MINKDKVIEVLNAEIQKHTEYAQCQREEWTKHGWNMFVNGMVEARDIIEDMSRQKANWSLTRNGDYRCSNCELITSSYKANFCPHCGSEMTNSASKGGEE